MVFASPLFLFLFLPATIVAYFVLPRSFRNGVLLVASLAFYAWGEARYVPLILASVAFNWWMGLAIARASDAGARKRRLVAAVSGNLATLAVFKYANFAVANVDAIAPVFGLAPVALAAIPLPLGISFFTFHAISYLVDIHRRDARAERSFVNLALYMLMFPQLIAGPILRFHTVARQLRRRFACARHIYYGGVLFCFGLGQKVLLADTLAAVADPLFARWQTLSCASAWLAAICYAFQIFFDFAGYSNMAIGLGWMTGFHFPKNFDYPYVSRSITEFWRRWHMTLSRWFRDYLYIPLGGNRHGEVRTYRNLLIVFLLCGLWHGAAWTFVLWGAYHGLLLVLERLGLARVLEKLPPLLQHAYALLAILIGWVLFRADSVAAASGVLGQMFLPRAVEDIPVLAALTPRDQLTLLAAVAFSGPWIPSLLRRVMALPVLKPWPRHVPLPRYAVGTCAALAILTIAALRVIVGSYSPFIYFRF